MKKFFLIIAVLIPLSWVLSHSMAGPSAQGLKALHEDLRSNLHLLSTGNPNGDVTIVEFSDYHCGYCKQFDPILNQYLLEDKNIHVVFKELPILGENSVLAAKAALVVGRVAPLQYYAFHTSLMALHDSFTPEILSAKAAALGVNLEPFSQTIENPDLDKEIAHTKDLARALGIRGTPTFVIGDKVIRGAGDLDWLKNAVAEARSAGIQAKY